MTSDQRLDTERAAASARAGDGMGTAMPDYLQTLILRVLAQAAQPMTLRECRARSVVSWTRTSRSPSSHWSTA